MKRRSPFFPRVSVAVGRLLVPVLLATAAAACGGGERGGGRPTSDLEAVAPPPDLAQLDQAVQQQFQQLRGHLLGLQDRAGEDRTGNEAELGSAWGVLGQWYDVYRYSESARSCYRNAETLAPDEPRWPYYLGILDESDGLLDQAEAEYRRSAELAPDVPAPRVRLGDIALRRQDLAQAERYYADVLEQESDNPGALFGSGRLALARDDPDAALAPLQELARAQPEAAQVNYTLSLVWRRLGDDRKADEVLGRVPSENLDQIPLDLRSSWDRELRRVDVGARTLTRRGVRAFHRGENQQAAVLLGRAAEADPNGAEKRINYALALREIGRWRAAADELHAALDRAAEGSELAAKAHLELGRLLVDGGRPRAAVPELEAALRIDPRSASAHLVLGRLLQLRGDLEGALAHYATVRGLDGDIPGVRFWHAALLIALDRERAAFDALTEDLGLTEDPSALELLLARLLCTTEETTLRDLPRARKLLDEVAQEKAPDVFFAETAAMVAAARGDFDRAVAWQSAAIDGTAELAARTPAHTARRRLVLYRERSPCRTPWERRERRVTRPVKAPATSS